MFNSVLLWAVAVGAAIAAAIGLLPPSKARFWLIGFWSLLPGVLFLAATTFSFLGNPGGGFYGLKLLLTFCAIVLPPWLVVTLLPFNLVRRVRDLFASPIDEWPHSTQTCRMFHWQLSTQYGH